MIPPTLAVAARWFSILILFRFLEVQEPLSR